MIVDWAMIGAAVAIKSAMVLTAAGLLAIISRKAPVRIRYAIWATALLGMLVLPLGEILGPHWRIADLAVPAPTFTSSPEHSKSPEQASLETAPVEVAVPHRVAEETLVASPDASIDVSTTAPRFLGWVLWLWALGAGLGLLSITRSWLSATAIARRAIPMEHRSLNLLAEEICHEIGIRRRVRLRISDDVSTPMTGGLSRPVVLLPAAAKGWSLDRLRLVLLHELFHVRRGDWLILLVARLVRALYWPNPLVWLAHRQLTETLEESCDEAVVRHGARPSDYAGHLLAIAETMNPRRLPSTALAMIHRSQLEGRLMKILNSKPDHASPSLTLVAIGAVLAFVLSLGSIEIWAQTPSPGDDGDREKYGWSGTWSMDFASEDGLRLTMRSQDGDVDISRDGRLELGADASVVIEAADGHSSQILEITATDGGQTYRWSVDGTERPFDEVAQQWLDAVMAIFADRGEIGRVRGQEGALRGKIGALRGKEGALRGRIGALHGKEGALRGRIGALRGRESALRGQIGALQGQHGALRGQIGALRGQISVVQRDREALTRLDSASDRLAELDALLADHRQKMIELERRLFAFDVDAQIAEIEQQIAELGTDAEMIELEKQLAELRHGDEIKAIEQQMAALDTEAGVAEIEGQIKALEADRRIAEIESGLPAKYDALRRLMNKL